MNPSKGYYSIIQYCPDMGKFEAANVGVLLYCPDSGFLKALTTRNNSRIIRFFGSVGHDWKQINSIKRGLAQRLDLEQPRIKTINDLREFIALRANVLQMTAPLPIKVTNAEQQLKELFEEIVGESASATPRRSLRSFVSEKLSGPGLDAKVARNIPVLVPVLEKQIEVPFGFQNGRFNLINTVRFGGQEPEHSLITACKYAVEGRSLYEHPDPKLGEMQLIVVGEFRANDAETPKRVRRVFDDYKVKLFKTTELPKLVDEIRRTGKELGGRKQAK